MPRIALAGLRAIAFWDSQQKNVRAAALQASNELAMFLNSAICSADHHKDLRTARSAAV